MRQNDFDLTGPQRAAWLEQATILTRALAHHAGSIYLELMIPRMGRRIDAVVIIGPVIFVLEFKVGETAFHAHDLDQVVDYALDLSNFHEGSHTAYIAPVLVCTKARDDHVWIPSTRPDDHLFDTAKTNADGLSTTIDDAGSRRRARRDPHWPMGGQPLQAHTDDHRDDARALSTCRVRALWSAGSTKRVRARTLTPRAERYSPGLRAAASARPPVLDARDCPRPRRPGPAPRAM